LQQESGKILNKLTKNKYMKSYRINTGFYLLIILFISNNIWAQKNNYSFFKADTLQSTILWKCDKHDGKINLSKGGFVTSEKQIEAGLFYIDMRSIKDLDMDTKTYGTAVLILDNTLKNDFFNIKKYPSANFKIVNIEKITTNKYKVTGDLNLHGVTNCLAFDASVLIKKNEIIMSSDNIVLDRTDWGIYRMSPQRPYSDDENGWTVPDKIEIKIKIIAKKES